MDARIEWQRNGYGFGHDLFLVLPETKTLPEQSFFLGQDAKICYRLLGMCPQDVARYLKERVGTCDLKTVRANRELARLIVKACGGMRVIRNLSPWALHVGGG